MDLETAKCEMNTEHGLNTKCERQDVRVAENQGVGDLVYELLVKL